MSREGWDSLGTEPLRWHKVSSRRSLNFDIIQTWSESQLYLLLAVQEEKILTVLVDCKNQICHL